MIEVHVVGLAIDVRSQPVILLKSKNDPADNIVLPIWIGPQEAASIALAIEGGRTPRPLAHDLMRSMIEALGATVQSVRVTSLDGGTFYAEIELDTAHGNRILDSRPSDAIALAARVGAPIFVAEEVFAAAGVSDESGLTGEIGVAGAADEEAKLEEFKKFLDEVDPEDFQG